MSGLSTHNIFLWFVESLTGSAHAFHHTQQKQSNKHIHSRVPLFRSRFDVCYANRQLWNCEYIRLFGRYRNDCVCVWELVSRYTIYIYAMRHCHLTRQLDCINKWPISSVNSSRTFFIFSSRHFASRTDVCCRVAFGICINVVNGKLTTQFAYCEAIIRATQCYCYYIAWMSHHHIVSIWVLQSYSYRLSTHILRTKFFDVVVVAFTTIHTRKLWFTISKHWTKPANRWMPEESVRNGKKRRRRLCHWMTYWNFITCPSLRFRNLRFLPIFWRTQIWWLVATNWCHTMTWYSVYSDFVVVRSFVV